MISEPLDDDWVNAGDSMADASLEGGDAALSRLSALCVLFPLKSSVVEKEQTKTADHWTGAEFFSMPSS